MDERTRDILIGGFFGIVGALEIILTAIIIGRGDGDASCVFFIISSGVSLFIAYAFLGKCLVSG